MQSLKKSALEDFLPEDGVGDLELDQESIEMITGMDASNIVVITHGGATASDAMRAWANERVGKTQRLAGLRYLPDLPRNDIGKILKRELRERGYNML